MKSSFYFLLFCAFFLMHHPATLHGQASDGKLRIIMFGGHPDDCDQKGGGTAALWSKMGHAVKFVSVTNGDAGHQNMKAPELAKRRFEETQECARRLGISYDVLDNHDGLLVPSLDVRLQIIKKIREWNADIVLAPRPNDYHPDHRYTGVLVQDAAYMVAVPLIMPEAPALKKNPVFLYFQDHFQRPNPFRPDISVDITSVFDQKIQCIDAHESQMYEWLPWIGHYADQVPADKADRVKWLTKRLSRPIDAKIKTTLVKWYGSSKAGQVKHAESFEICEYGSQPNAEEIKRLFPMLGK